MPFKQSIAGAGIKGRGGERSNLPAREVHNITELLETALGSPVVIIGGRSVNLWTGQHWRESHDLDVVINHKPRPEEIMELNKLADVVYGSKFEINGDPAFPARMAVEYSSRALMDAGVKGGKVKIDLYYPGYISWVNNGKPRMDISGLPISAIINRSETVSFEDKTFTVASVADLLIMKLDASLNDAGKDKNERNRHILDIKAIAKIRSNKQDKFYQTISKVRAVLAEHMPKKEDEIVYKLLGVMGDKSFNLDHGVQRLIKSMRRDIEEGGRG